jgi:hypothetical protein
MPSDLSTQLRELSRECRDAARKELTAAEAKRCLAHVAVQLAMLAEALSRRTDEGTDNSV